MRGAIDQRRVGLMGHSRGGGGVARFMMSKPVPGFTVTAVLALAPALGSGRISNDVITGAALAVVLATCDGDVDDLATQLGRMLTDDALFAHLRANARRAIDERFNLKRMVRGFVDAIRYARASVVRGP